MPDESTGSARKRFARDLRRIREDREVSVGEVRRDTQILTRQINAFETGTLFDQESMNEVYLRAFVRAYASAIGLPTNPVLDHLDRALNGTYENEAAVEFLGVPPAVAEGSSSSSMESSTEHTETDPTSDSEGTRRPSEEATGHEEETDSAKRAEVDDSTTKETVRTEESSAGEEEGETGEAAAERPDWLEEDGNGGADLEMSEPVESDASETAAAPASPGSGDAPHRSELGRIWSQRRGEIVVGVVALVVVLGVVAGVFVISDDTTPSSDEETNSAIAGIESDTESDVQADTAVAPPRRPRATVSLGDTMHVTVVAEGMVRRMRVRQDDDLRRPYWIVEGEAKVFPFTRRIMIQDRLDSVRVYFQRYPYPTTRTDDEGRIVITRETAQSIVDTLRGSAVSLSVEPDTVEIRTPPSDAGAQ